MLPARSKAEALLYLKVVGCRRCGQALKPSGPEEVEADLLHLHCRCSACGHEWPFMFAIRHHSPEPPPGYPPIINPSSEPSRLIDVGQWITLARVHLENAGGTKNTREVRRWKLLAAQCFEEALKFYDDPENDLPPPAAIFSDASQQRLLKAPEQFSRQRLLGEKARLPVPFEQQTPGEGSG